MNRRSMPLGMYEREQYMIARRHGYSHTFACIFAEQKLRTYYA